MANGGTSASRSGAMTWLLGGIVLGVLGTVFLPRLAAPYLPDALRGEHQEVAGTVNAKAAEVDRLLLTVGSDVGAMLVTYTKNVPEIDLLVDVGDSVVLVVGEYAPFVENAKIRRVTKQGKAATPDAGLRDPTPEPAAEPPADSSIVEGLTADGPESEAAVTDDTQ